jgi:formimidoylglutamate deiminase
VLCPTTEANLGDGAADLPRWLASDVALSVGSDSNVTRDAYDELRLLEYGQRLMLGRRNVAAAPQCGSPSTAATLLARIAHGRAAGFARWGLMPGARADLVVLDESCLAGVPTDALLDALVFSGPMPAVRHVMVAGTWVLRDRTHAEEQAIVAASSHALQALWSPVH